jgi:glycosyltransferase involved in cell wall biosynthesis
VPAGQLDLLFIGGLPPFAAGSAISTLQLLEGFAARGHRVRAVAPITPETATAGAGVDAGSAVAISWYPVPDFDWTPNIPAPDSYRQLERAGIERAVGTLLAARRPDVLIVGHEAWAWYGPAIAQRQGLPCLQLIRGNPGRGLVEGSYPAGPGAELLTELRKVDLIVTVARYLADGFRRLGFANASHIWNAVDLAAFAPRPPDPALRRELAIGPDEIVVSYVATAKAIKRPHDLIDSAALALRQAPRLVYLMVGDGPLRAELEAACRQKGLWDRFRFVGWVDYARVPDYLNLSDLVVLPSEAEGLARVYVETQACGRVLLASDIPAAREVIEPGVSGLLFARGDCQALAAQTLRVAADPDLRQAIGRAARQRAETYHGLAGAVSAYECLLRLIARA